MLNGKREIFDFVKKSFEKNDTLGLSIGMGIKIIAKQKVSEITKIKFPIFHIYYDCPIEGEYRIAQIEYKNRLYYCDYYVTFLKDFISLDRLEIIFYLLKCITNINLYKDNFTFEMSLM